MSFTDAGEKCKGRFDQCEEKSLETDLGKLSRTDTEGDSDESVSESLIKLKIISTEKTHKYFGARRNLEKNHVGRLNVSLRYSKHSRHCTKKNKSRKHKERKIGKKSSVKSKERSENTAEVDTVFSQRGKRCRLGGKAKGMPPEEETCGKYDSDEESDNCYYSRISLGYFQKFRDKSGASTSHQLEEKYLSKKNPSPLLARTEELLGKTSEELELLELQQWGKMNLVSSKRAEKLNVAEDIGPDTF